MELLLGTDLDSGTGWRSQLPRGGARAGWSAAGPRGLASRAGVMLGRPVVAAHQGDRLAAYADALAACDDGSRSYSRARAADPLGIARYLLGLRDELRYAGWAGGGLGGSQRLRDIAAVEKMGVLPGEADQLHELNGVLAQTRVLPRALRIVLVEPEAAYPAVLRATLELLSGVGAEIVRATPALPAAPVDSDLGRLQRALLGERTAELTGDGSVVLLEAETPLEAAELAAAWWAEHQCHEAAWIVAQEAAVLDAALQGMNLPGLGSTSASAARPGLQVLPLRLALAFPPRDPFAAMELLSLPCAPLPAPVRARLRRALTGTPAVGSAAWQVVVAEEPDAAQAIGEWFDVPASADSEHVSAADAAAVCGRVAEWARRRGHAGEAGSESLLEAAVVAGRLQRMLEKLEPGARLSRALLEQMHEVAAGGGTAWGTAGQAGRPAVVSAAAGILAPVDEVVWWGWAGPDRAGGIRWTRAERRALSAASVLVDAPGAAHGRRAAGWTRAVVQSARRLVLVRWRVGGAEPMQPHPLDDVFRARLGQHWARRCLVRSEEVATGPAAGPAFWQPTVEPVAPAPAVVPRPWWRLSPDQLRASEPLSPSSIEQRINCPMQWTLQRLAGLARSAAQGIPDGPMLVGTFAHAILLELLTGRGASVAERGNASEIEDWCRAEFDRRADAEAAPLLGTGRKGEYIRCRESVARAGAALVSCLRRGNWRPAGAEQEVAGTFAGLAFRGRTDLVLERGAERAVVDIKLGSERVRRDALRSGEAMQLALYAAALGAATALPPTAYFIVNSGRMLSTSDEFPGAVQIEGPGADETLALAEDAWRAVDGLMARGWVAAGRRPGGSSEGESDDEPPDQEPVTLGDRCDYCDFVTLCTAAVGGPAGEPGEEEA